MRRKVNLHCAEALKLLILVILDHLEVDVVGEVRDPSYESVVGV